MNDEVTEMDPFEIEIGDDTVTLETYFDTDNNTIDVTATDENTGEISTITYNKDTGELLENGIVVGTTEIETVIPKEDSAGFSVMAADKQLATMKLKYNINPKSVATTAALVWGIISGGIGFATTGITRAAINSAIAVLGSTLDLAEKIPNKPSINGYFQYTQYQRKVGSGYKYQNRSQRLYMRVNSGAYKSYGFNSSAWFTGTRPAY